MSKKILIADESDKLRELLVNILKSAGYDTLDTSNGLIALNLLKENSIGLIISDVNMDGIDGITLLKVLKEDDLSKTIPVIILTAETDDDIITEGRLMGASAWIFKPFQPELILEAVKKYFPSGNLK